MHSARRVVMGLYAFVAAFAPATIALADPSVWSGLSFEFVKLDNAFPYPVDQITDGVALTRAENRGLYNAVVEAGWNGSGPTGTEWATDINNPGDTIAATNFAALTFDSWLDAYGGLFLAGAAAEGRDAVVHLIEEDIYLDLRITHWTMGGAGGGFTYLRAIAPPTGDYNSDGVVDAADYVMWRRTYNEPAVPAGSGADGNQSGIIEDGDYTYWRERFGNLVTGSAGGLTTSIPEPSAPMLLLSGLLASLRRSANRHSAPLPYK